MLPDFWQAALPVSATTWNLHTTQPKYFASTYSEVVNITGLLKTKDEPYSVEINVCSKVNKTVIAENKQSCSG